MVASCLLIVCGAGGTGGGVGGVWFGGGEGGEAGWCRQSYVRQRLGEKNGKKPHCEMTGVYTQLRDRD